MLLGAGGTLRKQSVRVGSSPIDQNVRPEFGIQFPAGCICLSTRNSARRASRQGFLSTIEFKVELSKLADCFVGNLLV